MMMTQGPVIVHGALCRELALLFYRLRTVHHPNHGPGDGALDEKEDQFHPEPGHGAEIEAGKVNSRGHGSKQPHRQTELGPASKSQSRNPFSGDLFQTVASIAFMAVSPENGFLD